MGTSILKWLASLGTGLAVTAAAYITSHMGTGPEGVDPLISIVLVTAITKLVTWLTSKLPATPTA